MSMLSKLTSGAAASKKFSVPLPGKALAMASVSPSEASGPAAMMTSPSGMSVTSPSSTVMRGWAFIFSVTAAEKALRSTARAPPASTRWASAQAMIRLSSRRSSSFKSPTAFSI